MRLPILHGARKSLAPWVIQFFFDGDTSQNPNLQKEMPKGGFILPGQLGGVDPTE